GAPMPASEPARLALEHHYETIVDEGALARWLERIDRAGVVSFNLKTSSLDPMRASIVGVAVAVAPGEAAYIPLAHRYAGAPNQRSTEPPNTRRRAPTSCCDCTTRCVRESQATASSRMCTSISSSLRATCFFAWSATAC